ncbi:hypothetical protein GQ54DRAFT_295770 [Martensiomyces pterosporus]|nr:hypothetical protein GQ54DRAFT_295770 [Martensiomyces pterosporus]
MATIHGLLTVHTEHRQTGRTVVAGEVEYSLRTWSCTLQEGRPRFPNVTQLPYVKKVEFILHETFENSHRVTSRAPFRVEEEGWGEFDLAIIVHFVNCSEPHTIIHDLSFQEGETYNKTYPFKIPNPSAGLLTLFNKHPTVSRKTIPARATKARKGPPRDSAYSNSRRTPYYSDSDDSLSSDQDDHLNSSGDDSDAASPRSIRSKGHSTSSASTSSHHAKGSAQQPARDHRPSTSRKHGPLGAAAATTAMLDRGSSHDSHSRRLKHSQAVGSNDGLMAMEPTLSSPLSHSEEHRQRALASRPSSRTAPKGERDHHLASPGSAQQPAQPRRQREPGPSTRRLSNGMAAGGSAMGASTKQQPPPQRLPDTPNRSHPSAPGAGAQRSRSSALAHPTSDLSGSPVRTLKTTQKQPVRGSMPSSSSRGGAPERSLSPAARQERLVAPGATGAAKRRLSDVVDQPDRNTSRRRTIPADEVRALPSSSASSSSPPSIDSRGAHVRANGAVRPVKRPLAGGISDVKVPKKRGIKVLEDEEDKHAAGRERPARADDAPLARSPRKSLAAAARKGGGIGNGDDDRAASPPTTQQRSALKLSNREAFIRDRERQRQAQQAQESGRVGSSGIRTAKQPSAGSSGVSVRSVRTTATPATASASASSAKARRAIDASPPTTESAAAEPDGPPAGLPRRGSTKREVANGASRQQQQQQQQQQAQKTAPALPGKSKSRERTSAASEKADAADKAAPTPSNPLRMKRVMSQEKVAAAEGDVVAAKAAAPGRNRKGEHAEAATTSPSARHDVKAAREAPSQECIEKMERIMVKANELNERGLVKFLRLLHALRVEQEPDKAAKITKEAIDGVENDGEYACNLSTLKPEAIDRLWAFVREIRV